MAKKKHRANRVAKKPGAQSRKEKQRLRRQRAREPQFPIPETTVSKPDDFFAATSPTEDLTELLILAWTQAVTEGITIAVTPADGRILDTLADHTRGLLVYSVNTGLTVTLRGNVIPLSGNTAHSITDLLQRRYEHVSMLYLADDAAVVLPLLAPRFIPGSIVVLPEAMIVDFCTWAAENDREVYALLRAGRKAVVAMFAN